MPYVCIAMFCAIILISYFLSGFCVYSACLLNARDVSFLLASGMVYAGFPVNVAGVASGSSSCVQGNDSKKISGRGNKAVYGACVYLACQEEAVPRNPKEILAALGGDVRQKSITKYINVLKTLMKETKKGGPVRTAHPSDFLVSHGYRTLAYCVNACEL